MRLPRAVFDCPISKMALPFVEAVAAAGETGDESEMGRDASVDEGYTIPYPGFELVRLL